MTRAELVAWSAQLLVDARVQASGQARPKRKPVRATGGARQTPAARVISARRPAEPPALTTPPPRTDRVKAKRPRLVVVEVEPPPKPFGTGVCTFCDRKAHLVTSLEGPCCPRCHPNFEEPD